MKSILLIDTSIATQNAGDEIINNSIYQNWPELYLNNCIYRMAGHTPPFAWWQQLFFKKKCKAFRDADLKFLCGTNALYINMLRPVPQWNINLGNYSIYKGTVLLGVGAGINGKKVNRYTKALYSRVLNKEYYHSVRDDFSVELLSSIGIKAINTGCPTIWGLDSDICREIPTTKANKVVFTLTSYQKDEVNDKAMVEILEKNYEKLYFWPQTYSDLEYIRNLIDFDIEIIAPNLTAYDQLLQSDIDYVGNRLHGGIRALQHCKRTIIISIDYRAKNMSESYSLPVIERNDILYELDSFINRSFTTEIQGINQENIKVWKSQFDV